MVVARLGSECSPPAAGGLLRRLRPGSGARLASRPPNDRPSVGGGVGDGHHSPAFPLAAFPHGATAVTAPEAWGRGGLGGGRVRRRLHPPAFPLAAFPHGATAVTALEASSVGRPGSRGGIADDRFVL